MLFPENLSTILPVLISIKPLCKASHRVMPSEEEEQLLVLVLLLLLEVVVVSEAADKDDEVAAAAVAFAVVDLDDDNSVEEVEDIVTADLIEVESLTWPDRTAVTRST